MFINRSDYEQTLARYSNHNEAVELLKQYRPYLEMIPSMRRSEESLITIPLPVVKLRKVLLEQVSQFSPICATSKTVLLPCDLAYLMCDPEWKIKMGGEIFVFIHRPEEDLHVPGDHVHQGRPPAFVWHMGDLHFSRVLEEFSTDMVRSAHAAR